MMSIQQRLLNLYARWMQKPTLALVSNVPLSRKMYDLNAFMIHKTPMGYREKPLPLAHDDRSIPATICATHNRATHGTLMYLHGGGFMIGSLKGSGHLVTGLAEQSGQRGVYVDWRLAPEHPFPAGLDDAEAAFMALHADPASGPITVAGDSAGGNLTLALIHRLLAKGAPLPAAAVCFSPIVDLRLVNRSLETNQKRDPLVPMSWGKRGVAAYLNGQDATNPEISPLFGTFKGACPILIQYDTTEVLYDDCRLIAAKLRKDGVAVTETIKTGLPHVWQYHLGRSPEANSSVAEAAAFMKSHIEA
jgi:acetyl esterase/lipase